MSSFFFSLPLYLFFWWNVCSDLLPIFNLFVWILYRIVKFFMYSGYESVLCKMHILKMFPASLWLVFSYFKMLLKEWKFINVGEVHYVSAFTLCFMVFVSYLKTSLSRPRSQRFSPLFFYQFYGFYSFRFTFMYMIHFELTFLCKLQSSLFCSWMNISYYTLCCKGY